MSKPWHQARVEGDAPPYAITLAGKPVRTPTRRAVNAPTRALADAIVAEWHAQGEKVDPATMPMTRYINSILDTVADHRAGVVEQVAAYGASDLLCYRAGHPEGLVTRQAAAWDGPLTWAAQEKKAPMIVTSGLMAVEQPAASLAALTAAVAAHDDAGLAALHDLTSFSGSLILALAVSDGHLVAEDAWAASRVDEDWQIEQWGEDDLATRAANDKRAAFMDAARLLHLSQNHEVQR